MFNNNGYSLSDIAAVSGRNNNGFGDGDGCETEEWRELEN